MQLLQCDIGGRTVLVEDEAIVEQCTLDSRPVPVSPNDVHHFSLDLRLIGQGVTGVALMADSCLPIVSRDYFRVDRSPACGVRTIDRTGPVPEAPAGARRFFVFGVPGALGFQMAVSMTQVLEVCRPLPTASLNYEHSHYAGVCVWRGETIPVIDLALAAKLGTMRRAAPPVRMVIVRNRLNKIFAVPTAGPVHQPSAASQVYAPDSISVRPMRGIRGVFRYEGSPLLVPDLDALVE